MASQMEKILITSAQDAELIEVRFYKYTEDFKDWHLPRNIIIQHQKLVLLVSTV